MLARLLGTKFTATCQPPTHKNLYIMESSQTTPLTSTTTTTSNHELENSRLMTQLRTWSLAAGVFYASTMVFGLYAEFGVRDKIVDLAAPENTVESIAQKPMALRYSIMLDVVMAGADIMVAVLLGCLLVKAGANPILSIASSAFRFMQQVVIVGNLMHLFAASILLDASFAIPVASLVNATMGGGSREQADTSAGGSLAILFLAVHKYGYLLALLFYGLSLATLGAVIGSHGVFPKFLGWISLVGGISCCLNSFIYFCLENYEDDFLMFPVFVAEMGLVGSLMLQTPQLAHTSETMSW